MTRKAIYFMMLAVLMAVGAFSCGSSSSTTPTATTHTLTFTLEEVASAQVVGSAAKAVDPTGWIVACNCVDSSGTETRVTATYNSTSANFVVSGIPDAQDTVCYLDKGGDDVITLQYDDTNAIGSRRDTSNLTTDGSGKITYNSDTNLAVVSNTSGIAGTGAEDRTNYSTAWTINCQDIRSIVTNDVDSSKACPSDLQNASIYPHLVMSEDADGNLKTGYGMWTSADAYVMCGSTEGFDDLPSGWSLDSVNSPTQGNPFTWTSPFETFGGSSTSAEIMAMIRNASETGLQTFAMFQAEAANAEFCTGTDDICAAKYYEQVLRSYGRGSSVCWPDLVFNFSSGNVMTATPWPDMGSLTRPLSRYQFMESFKAGDMTYMHGVESQVQNAMNGNVSVSCNVKTETVVGIVAPGGDPGPDISASLVKTITPGGDPGGSIPNPGISTTMNFNSSMIIKSVSGDLNDDAVCQAYLGSSSAMVPNGFYSKTEMLAEVNPLPSP